MDLGLKGKKAIVTAASRGLGLATARSLAREGVNLTINARSPDALEAAAQENKPVQAVIDDYFQEHEPTSLIQRFVTAEEVAEAAVFLAGNGAANGSALRVEGGIIRAL